MKNRKILILAIFLFLALLPASSLGYSSELHTLLVFHSPTCHKCLEAKKEVLPEIEKEFKDRLNIKYYNILDIENYAFLLGLKNKYNNNIELAMPIFFINGNFLGPRGNLKSNLRQFINASLAGPKKEEAHLAVDLIRRFKDFRPLTIAGAGLVDGINPCAFTVIVFFISYLALQGYRKLELILIGLSFIFAVFLTYLLLGLGIFNFLYQLSGFWILAKVFNISIGIFSIILGVFAIYDFLKFKKTRNSESLLLKLPQAIKNQIHAVIGMHYRKAQGIQQEKLTGLRLLRLIISALISGFLVSILEAVCTGQLYLPTIAYILKTTPFKLKAFIYLVIYNILFILPLFMIFLLAIFGVTSAQFAKFIRRHMLSIKMFMAALFISLGVFLVWRG